jgi:hypothetical protein
MSGLTKLTTWLARGLVLLLPGLVFGQTNPASPVDQAAVELALARNCLTCHAGAEPAGEFDLTMPDVAVRGEDRSEPPLESLFWERIEAGEMPPEGELPAADRQLLEAWLRSGATWDRPQIDPLQLTTSARAGRDWWSLQRLHQPAVPVVAPSATSGQAAVLHPVDAFVLAKLQEQGLDFSPPAPPELQIRRVYFDLIGLPPPPEVVTAFQANPSDAHYEEIVKRLLDSPEYGERWARHWLDLVRFGESDGFERNAPRNQMWHYRDWVISAFNRDLPYDEFARQQIAGAAFLNDPYEVAAAEGFLVAGVHNTVVGSSRTMQLLARQDELEDLIGNVGQTFLGLTLNCARCHDHKFDPVTQEEYYQLVATFNGVNHGSRQVRSEQDAASLQARLERRSQLAEDLRQLEAPARAAALARVRPDNEALPTTLTPLLSWSFDSGLVDRIRGQGLQLHGDAKLSEGRLLLDGDGDFAATGPLPFDLQEKTLEAWLEIDNLSQRGGGVVSVETLGGDVFDAIVFAEREPQRWMAGSNSFSRTQAFGGTDETARDPEMVHLAISWSAGGVVTCYRNGEPHGQSYQTGAPPAFLSDKHQLLIGLRHSPAGGNRLFAGKIAGVQLHDRVLTAEEVASAARHRGAIVTERELQADLSPPDRQRRTELREELQTLSEEIRRLELAARREVYTQVSAPPRETFFLPRGDVTKPGATMSAGTTQAMAACVNSNFELSAAASDLERRRQFAQWVTHPDNPLFHRVIVNRLWQWHFGTGFVATASDFGFNGGDASHPELLDWLCKELQRVNYQLKPMHLLLVTSQAYRQDSRARPEALSIDTDNRWLWRKSPVRLDAEIIRDAMLAVTGKLNPLGGGPGFKDVTIVDKGDGTTYYIERDAEEPELNRRTIYRFSPRGGRSALLDSLDCPDPSTATPRRTVTTTPLQALSLLNSPFVLRMSAGLAERSSQQREGLEQQIEWMFQELFSRLPTEEERTAAVKLAQAHGLEAVARGLFNSSEFVTVR